MPVDFSPLIAPVPESPTSRGLTSVGSALDAVLARRQHQALMDQQIQERKFAREMLNDRVIWGKQQDIAKADADRTQKAGQWNERMVERRRNQDRQIAGLGVQAMTSAAMIREKFGDTPEADNAIESLLGTWQSLGQGGQQQTGAGTQPAQPPVTQGAGAPPPPATPPAGAPPAAPPPSSPPPSQGPSAFSPAFVESLPFAYDPPSAVMAAKAQAGVEPPAMTGAPVAPAVTTPGNPASALAAPRSGSFLGGNVARDAAVWKSEQMATREVQADPRLRDEVENIAASGGSRGLSKDERTQMLNAAKQRIQSEINSRLGAQSAQARAKGADENRDQTEARHLLEGFLDRKGYKLDQVSIRQFDRMGNVADLASKGNPQAARMFMGMYVKFAQGEVGVLNQNDLEIFWNKAGTPLDRTEAALSRILTGGLGKQQQKDAVAAIRSLQQTAEARLAETLRGGQALMGPYGEFGDRILRGYFGVGLPGAEAQRKTGLDDAERARMKAALGKGKK